MSEQHRKFLERLSASRKAVYLVSDWLRSHGRDNIVPDTRFSPTASEANRYLDSGDIILIGGDTDGKRVEVKQISHLFSNRSDWPFKEYFISNEAAVRRAGENVISYITVSKDYSFAAIVSGKTSEFWYLKETLARNTGNIERFVACPLEHVEFRSITVKTSLPCNEAWASYWAEPGDNTLRAALNATPCIQEAKQYSLLSPKPMDAILPTAKR